MAEHGYEPGVWHPELVGVIRRYPKTAEEYAEQVARLAGFTQSAREAGTLRRNGVPNGWRGRKPELEAIRRNSHTAAERLAQYFDPPVPDRTTDDEMAEVAMTFFFAAILDPTLPMRRRLECARFVMPYVLSKPRQAAIAAEGGDVVAWLERLAESLAPAMSVEE